MSTAARLMPNPEKLSVISVDAVSQLDQLMPLTTPIVLDGNEEGLSAVDRVFFRQAGRIGYTSAQRFAVTMLPLLFLDLCLLTVSFVSSTLFFAWLFNASVTPEPLTSLCITGILYVITAGILGLFPATGMSPVLELRQQVIALTVPAVAYACGYLLATDGNSLFLELATVLAWLTFSSILMPGFRALLRKYLARQSWWGERMLMVGSGPQAQAIESFYRHAAQRGLKPVGFVDSPMSFRENSIDAPDIADRYLGPIENAAEIATSCGAGWAIVAPFGTDNFDVSLALRNVVSIRSVILLPSEFTLPSLWTNVYECAGVAGIHVRDQLDDPIRCTAKRVFDIVAALLAIVVLLPFAPLFLLYVVWVGIVSPGPLFYGHLRVGRFGKKFRVWKFRTMCTDSEAKLREHLASCPDAREEWEREEKLKNDPRIIPLIGNLMRKTSLDELPQLINVLMGEMSLVGPRPRPVDEERNNREADQYPVYLRVRPGITGLWQVCGRNNTTYAKRVHLDSYYVRNWSPWLDLYILLRTFRTILLAEGAY